jgi:hypothetical protein
MARPSTSDRRPSRRGPALGPYERWLFGPGKTYDLPGLLLEDEASLSCVIEAGEAGLPASPGSGHWRVPTLYRGGEFAPRFCPALLLPEAGGSRLASLGVAQAGERVARLLDACGGADRAPVRLNFPVRAETIDPAFPAAQPPAFAPDPAILPDAPLVILAIIDHGIPFAHAAFRHEAGTRIDGYWAQSAPSDGTGRVLFGREVTRPEIDAMLADNAGDEEAVYRAAGVISRPGQPPMPLDRQQSHGAHVLGTQAGAWPAPTAAQVRVLAVDLPESSVWETSGFGKDMFLLAAMHYIFDRASQMAAALGRPESPVIVNLSYGHSGGPHDGTSLIEAALDEIVSHRRSLAPTALVLPAGNMFHDRLFARLEDRHFHPAGAGGTEANLVWFAPPDDRTSSFVELWLPEGIGPADIAVTVTAPHAPAAAHAPPASSGGYVDLKVGGRIVGQYALMQARGGRWCVTLAFAPSAPGSLPSPAHGATPSGYWSITVTRPAGAQPLGARGIDCRVQRDTEYGQGKTGARQSRFIDPEVDGYGPDGAPARLDPASPAAQVHRFGSLNGLAAARTALVAGGYDLSRRQAAPYSSAPPLRAQPGVTIDLSAPTERHPARPGIRSIGTRSGLVSTRSGTSSASPQVARRLAELLLRAGTVAGDGRDNYAGLALHGASASPVTDHGAGPAGVQRLGRGLLTPTFPTDP